MLGVGVSSPTVSRGFANTASGTQSWDALGEQHGDVPATPQPLGIIISLCVGQLCEQCHDSAARPLAPCHFSSMPSGGKQEEDQQLLSLLGFIALYYGFELGWVPTS